MPYPNSRFGFVFVMAALPFAAQSGGMPNVVPSYMKDAPTTSTGEPWNPAFSMAYLEGATPQDGGEMFDFGVEQDMPDLSDTSFYFRQSGQDDHRIERLRILIDNNAQPLVADYKFGPKMERIDLLGQVCLEKFSAVRAVATVAGGDHFEVGRYIESSQLCRAKTAERRTDGEVSVSFPQSDSTSAGTLTAQLAFAMPPGRENTAGAGNAACRVSVLLDDELLFDMSGDRDGACGKPIAFSFAQEAAIALTVRTEFAGAPMVEHVFALGS